MKKYALQFKILFFHEIILNILKQLLFLRSKVITGIESNKVALSFYLVVIIKVLSLKIN